MNPLSAPALVSPFAQASSSRRPSSPDATAGSRAPFPRLPESSAPPALARPMRRVGSVPAVAARRPGTLVPELPQEDIPWAGFLREAHQSPRQVLAALQRALPLSRLPTALNADTGPFLATLLAALDAHGSLPEPAARTLVRGWEQAAAGTNDRLAALAWTAAHSPQDLAFWHTPAALRASLQTTAGAQGPALFAALGAVPQDPLLAQAVTSALLGCWDYEPLASAYAAWLPRSPWAAWLPALHAAVPPPHLALLASQWPAATHAAWRAAGAPLPAAPLTPAEALQLQATGGAHADLVAAYLTDHVVQQPPHAGWGRPLARIMRHADFPDAMRLLDWSAPLTLDAEPLLRALSDPKAADVPLDGLIRHLTAHAQPSADLLALASRWHDTVARSGRLDQVAQWSLWWQTHDPSALPRFHAQVLDSLHMEGMAQRLPTGGLSATQLARALPWHQADLRMQVPPALQALAPRWYRHYNAWVLLRGGQLDPATQAAEPALRHLAELLADPAPRALRAHVATLCELAGVPRRRLAQSLPWMEPLLQANDPLLLPVLERFVAHGLSPIGDGTLLEALAKLPAPVRSFLQGGLAEPPPELQAALRALPSRAAKDMAGALLTTRLHALLDAKPRLREHQKLAEFCLQFAPANVTVLLREAVTRLGVDPTTLPVQPFPQAAAARARYVSNVLARAGRIEPSRQRWLHQLARALLEGGSLREFLALLRWVEAQGSRAWAERLGTHLRGDRLRPEQIGTPTAAEVAQLERVLHAQPMSQRMLDPSHPLCSWMPERFWQMRVQGYLNDPRSLTARRDQPLELAALAACMAPQGTPIPETEAFPELRLVRHPRQALQAGATEIAMPAALRDQLTAEQRRAHGLQAQHQDNRVSSVGKLLFYCRLAAVAPAHLDAAMPMILRVLREVPDVQARDALLRRLVSDVLSPHAQPSQRTLLAQAEAGPGSHASKALALACIAYGAHLLDQPAVQALLRSGGLHDGRTVRRLVDFILHTPTEAERAFVRRALTWGDDPQIQRLIAAQRPALPTGAPSGEWLAQQEYASALRSLHLASLRRRGQGTAAYAAQLQADREALAAACQRLAEASSTAPFAPALRALLAAPGTPQAAKALRAQVQAALKASRRDPHLTWALELIPQLQRWHADAQPDAAPNSQATMARALETEHRPSGELRPQGPAAVAHPLELAGAPASPDAAFWADSRARALHAQHVLPMVLALEAHASVLAALSTFDPARSDSVAAVQAAAFPLATEEPVAQVLEDLQQRMRHSDLLLLYSANMRRWAAEAQPERGQALMQRLVQAVRQGGGAVTQLRRDASPQLHALVDAGYAAQVAAWERGLTAMVPAPGAAAGAAPGPRWTVRDSGEPGDILAAMTQVESCQSVRKPEDNMGLQARLIDGSKRVILLEDAAGVLRARATLRLLRTHTGAPVVALSQVYNAPGVEAWPAAQALQAHLRRLAASLGVPAAVTHRTVGAPLQALARPLHSAATTPPAAWGLAGNVPDYWDEGRHGLTEGAVSCAAYRID